MTWMILELALFLLPQYLFYRSYVKDQGSRAVHGFVCDKIEKIFAFRIPNDRQYTDRSDEEGDKLVHRKRGENLPCYLIEKDAESNVGKWVCRVSRPRNDS